MRTPPCAISSITPAGTATRRPSIGRLTVCAHEVGARLSDVESCGSCPEIASSMIAASSTVRVIGPIWSRLEAKATSP
ncbi:MAG: hypothetical protein R3B46_10625 [Phycisphaerales bacterium]